MLHTFINLSTKEEYTLRKLVVNGEVWDNYFIDDNGHIYSNKRSGLKRLTLSNNGQSLYPLVTLSRDGYSKKFYVHRIVCEMFIPFPTPPGVTDADWKRTPASVKRLMRGLFQVNHIDHVHTNYHPSNLEWVTAKENQKAFQEHRKK